MYDQIFLRTTNVMFVHFMTCECDFQCIMKISNDSFISKVDVADEFNALLILICQFLNICESSKNFKKSSAKLFTI